MTTEILIILDDYAGARRLGREAAALGVPVLMLTRLLPAPALCAGVIEHGSADLVRVGGCTGDLLATDGLDNVALTAGTPPRIERCA